MSIFDLNVDFCFPEYAQDATQWDFAWNSFLNQATPEALADSRCSQADFCVLYEAFPLFHELDITHILIPGNGISLLPRFFCHLGYQTDVVDCSSIATDYSFRVEPDYEAWRKWFILEPDDAHSLRWDARINIEDLIGTQRQPGGTTQFRTEDLFKVYYDSGCYDAIFVQYFLDIFDLRERTELITRFHHWLRPGGLLVVQTNYLGLAKSEPPPFAVDQEIEQIGFVHYLKEYHDWDIRTRWGQSSNQKERKKRRKENYERDIAAAYAGKKLALIFEV